jgi:hypothetical protein
MRADEKYHLGHTGIIHDLFIAQAEGILNQSFHSKPIGADVQFIGPTRSV